jgi:hypothetical protein
MLIPKNSEHRLRVFENGAEEREGGSDRSLEETAQSGAL